VKTPRRRGALTAALSLLALASAAAFAADAPAPFEQLLPEDCVVAFLAPDLSAARTAAARTRLGEMYAQPEMQAFLAPALERLKELYAAQRQRDSWLPALEDLDAGLCSGGLAVALYPRAGDAARPFGLVVIAAPKDPAALPRMLPRELAEPLAAGQKLPLGLGTSAPAAGWTGSRLIVCQPKGDLEQLLLRAKGPPAAAGLAASPRYRAARERMGRPGVWLFVDAARASDFLGNISKPDSVSALVATLLGPLLGEDLTHFAAGLAFTPTDPVIEVDVGFAKPPAEGLLALCSEATPIRPASLRLAAPDAPFVKAGHFRFAALLPLARRFAQTLDPQAVEPFDQALARLTERLAFDIRKDFLENLGTEVVVAQTSLDTAAPLSLWPGLVGSVAVKDAAKLEECLKKTAAFLEAVAGTDPERTRLKPLAVRGRTVYYLSTRDLVPPLSCCVAGDRLLWATSLNALRRGLEQLERPEDILSSPAFQETLARVSGRPFDAQALPPAFSFALDRGSGTGGLVVGGLAWTGATLALGALANQRTPTELAQEANERAALAACLDYVEAQNLYHQRDWNADGRLEYARAFKGEWSLYEKTPGQGDCLLIDKEMADAYGEPGGPENRHGYRFRILTEQGAHAPGGAKSYLKDGLLSAHALVAYPATYGVSGRRTFLVDAEGNLHAKDLGAETAEAVARMKAYDPDETWSVEDATPDGAGGLASVRRFLRGPSGEVLLKAAQGVDLALWPDETFFQKYRRATGCVTTVGQTGLHLRCELPPPLPSAGRPAP
jgi:hypothetical protein